MRTATSFNAVGISIMLASQFAHTQQSLVGLPSYSSLLGMDGEINNTTCSGVSFSSYILSEPSVASRGNAFAA